MPRFKELPPNPPDQSKTRKPEARPARSRRPRNGQPKPTSRPAPSAPSEFAQETTVSRRGFAIGAASTVGIGAGIAYVVSRLGLGKKDPDEPDPTAPVVVDSGDATNITEEYEEVEAIRLVERASYDLPLGSVLNAAEGEWLPVVMPGETADAITCAGAFNLHTGTIEPVVARPIGKSPNLVVLDTRCSDLVYAWSEVNITDRSWTLYASAWRAGRLAGDTSTLWQGDADWDPPYFCCTGDQVLWQVQPSLTGTKTTESSGLYRWRAGDANAEKIMESQGRFACEPSVSKDVVTVVPRVPGESAASAYYGITALAKSDLTQVVDQLVMPASVRPFRAARVGDQFAFSVEATYGSGGLLANMGYYLGMSTGHMTWLSREPAAGVWGRDGVFAFKSRASYLVVDQTEEEFGVLLACDRAVDYGEYPAATGDTDTFVTYATVKDASTGLPSTVAVRVFDLVSAEEARKLANPEEEEEAQEEVWPAA